MKHAVNPTRVMWIDSHPQRPVCDVPWLGTTVVLSDGSVNFCCFSNAVVGNVNKETFEQIWSGPRMQRIRHSLVQQKLPPECESPSCPIYRGDKLHYIIERMDGPSSVTRTGTTDPHAEKRASFAETKVSIERQDDGLLRLELDVQFTGEWVAFDVFAALRFPDGSLRFLPGLEPYASPCDMWREMSSSTPSLRITLAEGLRLSERPEDRYELCVALFEGDSNPNVLSNCYWSSDSIPLSAGTVDGYRLSAV